MNCEMLDNLIHLIEDIYDCYDSLNEDISMIDKIEDLVQREGEYIGKLPKNISNLEEISVAVRNSYDNESLVKKHFVLDRFDSILDSLKANIESKSVQIDDGFDSYNIVNQNIICQLIEDTNVDKLRYLLAFSNINVERKLFDSKFDINRVKSLSKEELCKKMNPSEFDELYDESLSLEINKLLFEIIAVCKNNDYSDIISYNIEVIKRLLLLLTPASSQSKKQEISSNKLISDDVKKEFDLSVSVSISCNLDDFTDNKYVDIDTFNKLITLIKLEETILSKYDSLDINDSNSVSIFVNLLDYERDIVNSIMLEDDADKYIDLIMNDSSFFFEGKDNERKRKNIAERIYNLFPAFRRLFSDYSLDYYDLVISNHIVNSLERYRNIMCDLSDEQFNKYVLTYKDIIFKYPNLLDDIMALNGDFTALFSFDDMFSSNILKLGSDRSVVYSINKDEILYNLAQKIITELGDILISMDDDSDLISLYEFKICEFNDIINNINTEHLYALEADVECISNSKIKSILMNSLPFYHKY